VVKNPKNKKPYIIASAILLIALWAVLLIFVSPTEIIENIGVQNAYIIIFLLAVIGGLSTLTGSSFFVTLATFASGGADPFLLGIIGGLGIFISDSIFFFLANQGVKVFDEKESLFRVKILRLIEKVPQWLLGVFVFIYVGFTPLPNDILMLGLALGKVRYRSVALAILAGSFSIALITAFIGGAI
jgi:hypothetical protein